MLVVLQVLGELIDPTRQHRDLYLRRTGVALFRPNSPMISAFSGLVEP
jgi:hypothetical protein